MRDYVYAASGTGKLAGFFVVDSHKVENSTEFIASSDWRIGNKLYCCWCETKWPGVFDVNNSFTEKCENCTARELLSVFESGSFLLLRGGNFGDNSLVTVCRTILWVDILPTNRTACMIYSSCYVTNILEWCGCALLGLNM